MPTRLTLSHIEAERRLRVLVSHAVAGIWNGLPGYDQANVDEWLTKVLPVVTAAQHQSIALTDAYLARALDTPPVGLSPAEIIAAVRSGTEPEVTYKRPFIEMWSKLGNGVTFLTARDAALARAQGMSAFDIQGAMARSAQAIGTQSEQIQRFQRVADGGACAFCQEVDGAILNSDDVMPLHNNCGCSVEPLTDSPAITPIPAGVRVAEHGEMGPLLVAPDQNFTTEHEALN